MRGTGNRLEMPCLRPMAEGDYDPNEWDAKRAELFALAIEDGNTVDAHRAISDRPRPLVRTTCRRTLSLSIRRRVVGREPGVHFYRL
jgi:hypothetical protein